MRKQFYRVKQLADQRVGRAEKTEILSVDLQNVEKNVDKIKLACQSASKRIGTSLQGGSGNDFDRRLKKLNQTGLANSMLESSNQLGDGSVLGIVLSEAGDVELSLARDLCEYEMSVEKNVMVPMTTLLENDIPNLYQAKKKLSKAALDMDTCKSRYMTALKASQGASKDLWAAAGKADALKNDLEDETAKFESCQDNFTTEALTFVSKEGQYAEWIIKFMDAQLEYHRKATAILEKVVPSLKTQVDGYSQRPVFGCPLEEHLKIQHRTIALVLEECLTYLHEVALEEQGIFRLAGSSTKIRKLKAAFNAGLVDLNEMEGDIHVITGILKQYLRELPEPLMTFHLYNEWIQASSIQEEGARLQAYWTLVEKLPKVNKDNLRYLICFMGKLAEYSNVNKMTPSNIAIVIAPNIIYSETETSDAVNLSHTGAQSSIVEALIQNYNWFFPEGVDFFRHTLAVLRETNGSGSVSTSPPVLKSPVSEPAPPQKKASTGEFKSVTGGLLDEIDSMINNANSEGDSNGSPTSHPDPTKSPAPRTHSPAPSNQHPSKAGATQFVLVQEKTKRPAPSPVSAQVKYIGSTSPIALSPPAQPSPPPLHPSQHVTKTSPVALSPPAQPSPPPHPHHPTQHVTKPPGLPPPPPSKSAAAPGTHPKPAKVRPR